MSARRLEEAIGQRLEVQSRAARDDDGLPPALSPDRSGPECQLPTTVTYDALGLLDRDTGADNGFLQTVRTEDAKRGSPVFIHSYTGGEFDHDGQSCLSFIRTFLPLHRLLAEGRTSTFRVEEDAAGSTIRKCRNSKGMVSCRETVLQNPAENRNSSKQFSRLSTLCS